MTQESSKLKLREESPTLRQIAGVLTAVIALAGVTERGPIGEPTLCQSKDDYERVYGGYVANGEVAQAVDGIFTNAEGVSVQVWVSRVVHVADPTNPATKTSAAASLDLLTPNTAPSAGSVTGLNVGPFPLANGDTLVLSIDGGGNLTATFNAAGASRASGNGPFNLTNGQTLTAVVNGGPVQTVTFTTGAFVNIAAATPAEVAAVLNAGLVGVAATVSGSTAVLTTDRKGSGATLNITGGTANAVLGFTTGSQAGTGNVANIGAVTTAEVKAVVEAAVAGVTVSDSAGRVRIASNTTGPGSSVQVIASATADDELGLDNALHAGGAGAALATLRVAGKYDGTYGNTLTVRVAPSSSGDPTRFNLSVFRGGVEVEKWPNLSMLDTDESYAEKVVNALGTGSKYVVLTDLDAATPSPNDRPTNGTFGPLTGGNDGLAGLVDADFIGGSSDSGKTGLRTFDRVAALSLLAVPGRATPAMHNAMVAYCEVARKGAVFAVLDPPAGYNANQMADYVDNVAGLANLTEYGGMYWPRVLVSNPQSAVFGNGTTIAVAPSGYVLGVMARTDGKTGGVYTAPAGVENGILFGVLGFESPDCLEEDRRDIVAARRINPLTTSDGFPRYIDGHDTLKSTGNFPSVSERRGVIFIEQSIARGLQFVRHRNHDESLRQEATRVCETFLTNQMDVGAFRTRDPSQAFSVDFSTNLNTDAVVASNRLLGKIGLATQKPVQIAEIGFSQKTLAPAT